MSYHVVLQGRFAADIDPAAAKRKFIALTGQTEIVTERLFSGSPTVIKRQLNHADAERIVSALRAIGADASVAPDAAPALELAPEEPVPAPAARETLRMAEPERPAPHETLSLQEPGSPAAHEGLSLEDPTPSRAAPEGLSMETPELPAAPPAPAPVEAAPSLPPLPPPPPLEEMYRAIIGPARTEFYLRHFMRRDAGGPMLSWNWHAVLAQFFWSLHRKLWRFAFFGLAFGLIIAAGAGYLFTFAVGVLVAHPDPIFTRIGSVLAGAVAGMVVGALGNDAYQRRALQLIRDTAHISDPARRLASLAARGGTSQSWRWALAATAVLGALGATGVMLGVADPQSSAEAATPRAQRIPGSNYLAGRWRCTSQATGRITYWEYAASGGVSYFGENAQETVPLMGPEIPNRWSLQDNVLHWTNAWQGLQWSADNSVLDLSREFMHYTRTGGESVICARP